MKRYRVSLTKEEIEELTQLTQKGTSRARVIRNAFILLGVDEGPCGKAKTDQQVAELVGVTVRTIEYKRKCFIEHGYEAALYGKPRKRSYESKLDGDVEAHLIALSCSEPPAGIARWTLRLLAERMVALEYVEEVSHETVRRVLKKCVETLEKQMLGDSPEAKRSVCGGHGTRAGCLPAPLQSEQAGREYG